jgi:hypothetical protein
MKNRNIKKEMYCVHFEASLTNKSVAEAFKEFLKTEFNEDSWNFLEEVKKLKETKEKEEITNCCVKIFERYLSDESKFQLNISSESKENLKKNFNFQGVEPDTKMFDFIEESVKGQLRHDSWKRFYRSKYCEEIIYQHYNDSSICSPVTTLQYFYNKDFFVHPHLDDSDFDFGNILLEDSFEWEVFNFQSQFLKVSWY